VGGERTRRRFRGRMEKHTPTNTVYDTHTQIDTGYDTNTEGRRVASIRKGQDAWTIPLMH
jgi:hypothetical protein